MMQTSVIVPTYNGAHRILTVLDSLTKQLLKPDEVIVVIDGSTDNTAELIAARDFSSIGLRVVERANGGRAKVRNTGAAAARYELLLFIDDDMIAPPEWLACHYKLHEQLSAAIVTGMLEDPPQNAMSDFLRFKMWLHQKWTKGFQDISSDPMQMTTPYLTANNMSIPKHVFDSLQGFDERLTDAEDYDMAVRALRSGVNLFFSKTAIAVNNDIDNVSCERYIRRIREYTAAQKRLRELKPELYADNHRYHAPVPQGIKGAIFKLFCKRGWINAVDKGWLRFLPPFARYKLYDVIITANGSYFTNSVKL